MTDSSEEKTATLLDCEQALDWIREFRGEGLAKGRMRTLRAHMATCKSCLRDYRDGIETTAGLARFTVEEREAKQIEHQRRARHAKAFGDREAPRKKIYTGRLRFVLVPALAIFVMTQFSGWGPPPAKVELVAKQGIVRISRKEVTSDISNLLVLPGRWVSTFSLASATLDCGKCLVRVGADTELMVESAKPLRFRLKRGYTHVDGDVRFVTVLGIVDVKEGRGSLKLTDIGLTLEPESGEWTVVTARGEEQLAVGEVHQMRP
jgi:hypothetical protein